ncbi:MAG: hypothetical protein Q9163_000368 [Psora crenata]
MPLSSHASCVSCERPLILYIEPDEEDDGHMEDPANVDGGSYVDDDVYLQCGCHFHWQCLLDAYSVTECPSCGKYLTSTSINGQQQILCDLKNEGGLQKSLDILPLLAEETYLKAYPEERKCQAFLEFCGDGDIAAIVDLLKDDDDQMNSEQGAAVMDIDVLRYQDHIRTMNSALHVAIQNQQECVAWLLLLLASNLDQSQFPAALLGYAEELGLKRNDLTGKVDIRTLRDAEGMTAEQRAASVGGIWENWIRVGRLKPQ